MKLNPMISYGRVEDMIPFAFAETFLDMEDMRDFFLDRVDGVDYLVCAKLDNTLESVLAAWIWYASIKSPAHQGNTFIINDFQAFLKYFNLSNDINFVREY